MKNIVTIMNFVRGVDQRYQATLFPTAKIQFELLNGSGLKSTFLLQHDAVIDPAYADLFRQKDGNMEIGLWFEICKSCVTEAGVRWRGREGYDFDWFSNTDTVTGYTEAEKIRLIDTAMERFRAVFGYYPKTVGAWVLDSFTIDRLGEKYGVVATCNCKDQWGTDGYTLFGGYYDNAYYPAKKNVLCPAQTLAEQISVPHFRLLGCDPLYQYDCFLWSPCHVMTLEPWKFDPSHLPRGGGADPEWVDWYFHEVFESGRGGAFNYAQIGQENSFPWEGVKDGFLYQLKKVREMKARGVVEDMTFAEAGQWFKDTFPLSPACTHTALSDWMEGKNKSVWYYCRHYRLGLFLTDASVYIRDWHLYDEQYPSLYDDAHLCTEPDCFFFQPPLMNGVAWSDAETRAGYYFVDLEDGQRLIPTDVDYREEKGGFTLTFTAHGKRIRVEGMEDHLTVTGERIGLSLEYAQLCGDETLQIEGNTLRCTKGGFPYSVTFEGGHFAGHVLRVEKEVTVRF